MSNNDDSTALYHGEIRPLPSEFLATGIFGIILFLTILIASTYLLIYQSKTRLNRLFYGSLILMAKFESVRYFFLAVNSSYNSTIGYAMHTVAGIFYFICLAIIGLTFANVLELGSLSMMIYGKRGLSFAVLLHSLVDVTSAIICLQSKTLAYFFRSKFYLFFMAFDILQNLLYSSILVVYGIRLIVRYSFLGKYAPTSTQRSAFLVVVKKVTKMLSFISIFSIIRLILLGLKFSSIQNSEKNYSITTPSFSLYGFLWFCIGDFLPRGASSIALAILMQSDNNQTEGDKTEGLRDKEEPLQGGFEGETQMQSITNPSHAHVENILRKPQMLSGEEVQENEVSGTLVYSPEGGGLGRLGSPLKPFGGDKNQSLKVPYRERDVEEGSMRKAERHEDIQSMEEKTDERSI